MYDLPLFPLNTVLFPGMPITLHVFEPRYRLMMQQCIQSSEPFGVVLIKKGVEASGPLAEPYPIGCTARITQVDRTEDGRMNIVAVGIERFQIRALDYDKPYLVGKVEMFPLDSGDDSWSIDQAGHQLRPWVERYLNVLSQASNELKFDPDRLPEDPLALAYLAASVVQIPLDQKQTLLSTSQKMEFLTGIRSVYRREVALLNAILERDTHQQEEQGLFSLN